MEGKEYCDFISLHSDDDAASLLLAASGGKFEGTDIKKAVRNIEARRRIAAKLPHWHSFLEIDYPSSLSLEQCSSEVTATYKQKFVKKGYRIADITGGLGVDCYYMSRDASEAFYIERQSELCKAAENNFAILGADNISVINADRPEVEGRFNLIYADPARRGKNSERVYSIADCEPDILEIKGYLLSISDAVLIKISPMADISRTLELVPETKEVHVVSSSNECKEVLLYLTGKEPETEIKIICVNLKKEGTEEFGFTPSEESEVSADYADRLGKYLFQPNKSILKAGAFKLIGKRFGLKKLSGSTHLYTSDTIPDGFPGKVFEIKEMIEWSKKSARWIASRYPVINLSSVNFPMDSNSLKKRLGIKDGGDLHLFATTMGDKKICLVCKRMS